MIEDREISSCANAIIRQYGDAATFHAAQRADELLEVGDVEGQRTWLRILIAIRDLETIEPPSSLLN